MGQRGLARPKIVERDAHAAASNPADFPGDDFVTPAGRDILVHLQKEVFKRDAGSAETVLQLAHEIAGVEVAGCDVHTDSPERKAGIEPGATVTPPQRAQPARPPPPDIA